MTCRFEAFGRERWGWNAATCESKWADAMSDPAVPKGTDEEGWTTVAKYVNRSLKSARHLEHSRSISQHHETQAAAHELRSVATDLLETSSMASHTGVFDISSLPGLPGFGRLGTAASSNAKSNKARARKLIVIVHDVH